MLPFLYTVKPIFVLVANYVLFNIKCNNLDSYEDKLNSDLSI